MLPTARSGRVADFESTVVAMLDGLHHGHPLVNGYTGLFPDGEREFRSSFRGFPDDASVAQLRERKVRWAIIDRRWLVESRRSRLSDYSMTIVHTDADVVVVELGGRAGFG